ncbi:HEAT repeat domain-containing protein [Vulgatibacter sp.]|uniref:HEAT repeat domain-containing protein n=1 Tax=Vulgatibacter sp. TaxID=1971226 RepID=UPI003564E4F7
MRLTVRVVAALLCVSFAGACSKGDPNDPQTWVKQLSAEEKAAKLAALEKLADLGDKSVSSAIVPLLQEGGEVKVQAVKTLAKLGDPASVPALIDAIDLGVGAGSDPAIKRANEANKEIAEALAELGDKSAVEPLSKLAERSKDSYAKIAAINALGELGDSKAVPKLVEIATDEGLEPYVNKKAVQALGNIGDPGAVPAIKKMLFHERKGISFYSESSFAAYQIGIKAAEPLLVVLEGKDESLNKWADEHDIYREALYAKAAQVLGDLNEERAVPTLIKYLNYSRPGSDPDAIDPTTLIVRRQAADALSRMRVKGAVDTLVKNLKEEEGNLRAVYADALVAIGDRKALSGLESCALKGNVLDKSNHARKGCYVALSRLGDEKTLATWEKWEKAEPAASVKGCMREVEYDDAKGKEAAQQHCDELGANVVKILADNKARLVAYNECKADVACWSGKLKDENPLVRERAAIELGHIADPASMPALLAALADKNLEARFAAIMAVDWVASQTKPALEEAKKGLAALDKQINTEKDKIQFVKINEDLKRLAVKIRRLDRIGS